MKPKPAHPSRLVYLNQIGEVPIDIEIIELVKALCELGWITENSCQDNIKNRVWVAFFSPQAGADFMDLIARKNKKIRECVLGATTQMYDESPRRWKVKNRWWVDSFVKPIRPYGYPEGSWDGIVIRLSIRFPRKHLEKVTKIVVKERNRRLSDDK